MFGKIHIPDRMTKPAISTFEGQGTQADQSDPPNARDHLAAMSCGCEQALVVADQVHLVVRGKDAVA